MATRKIASSKPTVSTGTGQSGRQRPRASVACANCRARKVRCDVQRLRPGEACRQCRTANVQCIVFHQDDRRRNGSRHHIIVLQDRLQSIEAMIRHGFHQMGQGAMEQSSCPGEHEESLASSAPVYPVLVSSSRCTSISPGPSPKDSGANADICTPATEASTVKAVAQNPDRSHVFWPEMPEETYSSGRQNPELRDIASISVSSQKNEGSGIYNHPSLAQMAMDPPVLTPPDNEQLPRQDADNSLGQFRSYRPTAQPPMELSPVYGGIEVATPVNSDSSQVRKLLLDTAWRYFALQPSIVHEQYFLFHRGMGMRSQYYSPFLENSLLACASRVSTSEAVRNLGNVYMSRAMQDIPVELEDPTLATLQGFLLLADFEVTRGRNRLGWTYMGIAYRLLFDFGLYEGVQPPDNRDDLPPCDTRWLYTVFVSTFVYDTLWSLHMGRPRTISLPILRAAWGSIQSCVDNGIIHIWVELCLCIAEVSDILNACSPLGTESVAQLLDIDARIQHAHEVLPPGLAYYSASVNELDAAAYAYHMQFYSTKIAIHRALIRSSLSGGISPSEDAASLTGGFRYNPDSSCTTMYESAVCITELTVTYRQIFGLDRIITVMLNNIYMAAVPLINHVLVLQHQHAPVENDINQICLLVDTLGQVQKHFPIAFRMCYNISQILNGTSLASLVDCIPIGQKQAESQAGSRPQTNQMPQMNSWDTMGAVVNNRIPEAPMNFGEVFDERN